MQYATLEEAYNITTFKKNKKIKKQHGINSNTNIKAYDTYDTYESTLGMDTENKKKTSNHCEQLQAPPYVFPIDENAKQKFNEVINSINKTDTKIESNMNDELDSYLDNIEYTDFIPNTNIPTNKKDTLSEKIVVQNKVNQNSFKKNSQFDRLYELLILIILALLIIILCEVIVRIASK